MTKYMIKLSIILLLVPTCQAQYGVAENGYYPPTYNGQTFTGVVVSTNDETREVTLNYTNPQDGQTQTFVGVIQKGYSVRMKDGSLREVKPSTMKAGATFRVYYSEANKKINGVKTTVKTIFLIAGYPDDTVHYLHFKAFR